MCQLPNYLQTIANQNIHSENITDYGRMFSFVTASPIKGIIDLLQLNMSQDSIVLLLLFKSGYPAGKEAPTLDCRGRYQLTAEAATVAEAGLMTSTDDCPRKSWAKRCPLMDQSGDVNPDWPPPTLERGLGNYSRDKTSVCSAN